MNNYKPYTMIGSRETPAEILMLMEKIAISLFYNGWTVRSGGANGADSAAESVKSYSTNHLLEVYLPWDGFNNHWKSFNNIIYSELGLKEKADKLCGINHQYWYSIKKESIKHLHRRNIHQILGMDLKSPSNFVICYARPDQRKRGVGHVQGGTGTAVSLALSEGIEVINLYFDSEVEKMRGWLNE